MELLAGLLGGALIAALMFIWVTRRKRSEPPTSETIEVEPVQLVQVPRPRPPVPVRAKPAPAQVEELVLGDPDAPVMRIRPAPTSLPKRTGAQLALPPAAKSALAQSLQHAPRLLIAGANAAEGAQRLVLTFTPDAAKALASGGLELTPSSKVSNGLLAIARDSSGKRFVENGVLVPKVNALAVATAAWQVAAIVTSQKFLADINTKLASIGQQIEAVRTLLEDEIVGRLRAHSDYLRDRAAALREGRLQPAELHAVAAKLEDIDTDARATAHQMLRQLERVPAQLRDKKWGGLWSTGDVAGEVISSIDAAGERGNAFMLAGEVRVLVLAMRGALDLSAAYATASGRTLADDVSEHDNLWRQISTTVHAKLPELSATMQWEDTDKAHRASVEQVLTNSRQVMTATTKRLTAAAERLEHEVHLQAARRDMELLVEVDASGKIVRADRLLET